MEENKSIIENSENSEPQIENKALDIHTSNQDEVSQTGESEVGNSKKTLDIHTSNQDEVSQTGESEVGNSKNEKVEVPEKDYSQMSMEGLLSELKNIIENYPVQFIGRSARLIKLQFDKLVDEDKKEKELQTEEGEEFSYSNPIATRFNDLWNIYKTHREQYAARQVLEQRANLEERLGIIEELKALLDKEEAVSFKEFQSIQQRWKTAGNVPREHSSALWQTYHLHVEHFFDYLKLNREYRDREFAKNLEEKQKLILRAEELVNEPSIKKAFEQLQGLHRLWKEEIGAVAKEFREPLWKAFSEATAKVHQRRQNYYNEIKSSYEDNLEAKNKICQQIKALTDNIDTNSHKAWQKQMEKLEELKQGFKKVGAVASNKKDEIWNNFKEATKHFNKVKNEFYKTIKKTQFESIKKKEELVQRAKALQESEEWEMASEALKGLQVEWKNAGHVAKAKSDELWTEFRAACNTFFDRFAEHRKSMGSSFAENKKIKAQFIDKTREFVPSSEDKDAIIEQIKALVDEYRSIGKAGKDGQKLDEKFNKLIDANLEKYGIDKNALAIINFKNRLKDITEDGDKNKLRKEIDFARRMIDELSKTITQLENNVSFFSKSSSKDSPIIKEVLKKIEKENQNKELWKQKLDFLKKQKLD